MSISKKELSRIRAAYAADIVASSGEPKLTRKERLELSRAMAKEDREIREREAFEIAQARWWMRQGDPN